MNNERMQDIYYFERWLLGIDPKGCFGFLLPHKKQMIQNLKNGDPLFKNIVIVEWKGEYPMKNGYIDLGHPETIMRVDKEFVLFDAFRDAFRSKALSFLDTDLIETNVRNGVFALHGIQS